MFTTEPLIILHKPFSLSCAYLCKLQLLLTKNLRFTFTPLSHKFHTQLISKSYLLYLQNRYQTRLLLTTSIATILVQRTIICYLNKCNSQSDLPASTFIINSKLGSQSAPVKM